MRQRQVKNAGSRGNATEAEPEEERTGDKEAPRRGISSLRARSNRLQRPSLSGSHRHRARFHFHSVDVVPRGGQGRSGAAARRALAFTSALRHLSDASGSGDTCELEKLREDNSLKDCLRMQEKQLHNCSADSEPNFHAKRGRGSWLPDATIS